MCAAEIECTAQKQRKDSGSIYTQMHSGAKSYRNFKGEQKQRPESWSKYNKLSAVRLMSDSTHAARH